MANEHAEIMQRFLQLINLIVSIVNLIKFKIFLLNIIKNLIVILFTVKIFLKEIKLKKKIFFFIYEFVCQFY